ncbi:MULTISPECIES: GNAT family N-acetyltransferase [Gemmobacter]|uniref:Putative N-acetyltransferase YhbS n=1 Tax=Gemmobacter caeni TaxID=589035 RepID=A0A2T6B1Q6_9RHOB|nr:MULTISPECIES: GNAT family N-acetyltransferase [Gemmobacter]PTX50008.1 putative N-acetyltransferase YhbS [Gemmobacter caeni]TWJ01903.1 putative N-acetyltransferase YhbS [Gemmobacter caeni]
MIRFRTATRADVPAIVALLTDDPLGRARESSDLAPYLTGFDAIAANPMHEIIVGEVEGRIVATCQLTILHGLSRQGMTRALVESVRTAPDLRSKGIGAALMAEAESRAHAAGARIIQLTTDKSRTRAHAFYDRLGYEASHLGYKKSLD